MARCIHWLNELMFLVLSSLKALCRRISISNKQLCLLSITKWRLKQKYLLWIEWFLESLSGPKKIQTTKTLIQKKFKHAKKLPKKAEKVCPDKRITPLTRLLKRYQGSCDTYMMSCHRPGKGGVAT